jgi:HK97 family phage prohead protease
MKETRELRTYTGTVELRMDGEDSDWPAEVTGVAAVVNQATDIGGWFEEEIARGAFDSALQGKIDIPVLFNHDANQIVGRTTSGTAKVWVNDAGHLAYSFVPDAKNPVHQHVVRSIQRGDITQSSFAFTVSRAMWSASAKYGDDSYRTILEVKKLYDVSPVTYPAYSGTSVGSRDAEAIESERAAIIAERSAGSTKQADAKRLINQALKKSI